MPTDNVVFGGFCKRFIYQGKWHVLVDNIYHYEPTTKTLNKRSSKSLIRLNDEKDISIIDQNMNNNLWYFYNNDNLIIEENKIWYHQTSSSNGHIAYGDTTSYARSEEYGEKYPYTDLIKSIYRYVYTDNLVKIK